MNANEMWKAYTESLCSKVSGYNDVVQSSYEAWAFCDGGPESNHLASLVLAGTKRATSSAFRLYELEGESLPAAGEFNVILFANNRAACVARTVAVDIIPFKDITARHAYLEGEGDKSLSYWSNVHKAIFEAEFEEVGLHFDGNERMSRLLTSGWISEYGL